MNIALTAIFKTLGVFEFELNMSHFALFLPSIKSANCEKK